VKISRILSVWLVIVSLLGNFAATGIAMMSMRPAGGCLPGGGCCCDAGNGGRSSCPMDHTTRSTDRPKGECGLSSAACHPITIAGVPTLTKDVVPGTFPGLSDLNGIVALRFERTLLRESISPDPLFHPPTA
jgi:hypothetical protein